MPGIERSELRCCEDMVRRTEQTGQADSRAGIQALFVHGMGRSPVSGWPLLWHLRRAGIEATGFAYSARVEDFSVIEHRLVTRLGQLAAQGDYAVIGHSLGGVLLRAAILALPAGVRRPRHLFLLGSPVRASLLAQRFAGNPLFRMLTGDCGRLLASPSRMAAIGAPGVPVTAIIGERPFALGLDPEPGETSDGIVTLAETRAEWQDERILVRQFHSLLPSSLAIAGIIERRLMQDVRNEA